MCGGGGLAWLVGRLVGCGDDRAQGWAHPHNTTELAPPCHNKQVPYKAPGTDYHRYVGIYQRLYYDRVLLCGQFIDDNVANNIMSILWYLHKEDKHKPIYMCVSVLGCVGPLPQNRHRPDRLIRCMHAYIHARRYFNVPGALLRPALSVYDTMKAMSNEIETINIGLTTGAFTVAAYNPVPLSQTHTHAPIQPRHGRLPLQRGHQGSAVCAAQRALSHAEDGVRGAGACARGCK